MDRSNRQTQRFITKMLGSLSIAQGMLRRLARRDDFLLVGDTKLISAKNILAACQAGVFFCAPAPNTSELRETFGTIPRTEFQPLNYLSEREERKPEAERSVFLGTERTWTLGNRKAGIQVTVRWLFVLFFGRAGRLSHEPDSANGTG